MKWANIEQAKFIQITYQGSEVLSGPSSLLPAWLLNRLPTLPFRVFSASEVDR